jgi:hypothetical protein
MHTFSQDHSLLLPKELPSPFLQLYAKLLQDQERPDEEIITFCEKVGVSERNAFFHLYNTTSYVSWAKIPRCCAVCAALVLHCIAVQYAS